MTALEKPISDRSHEKKDKLHGGQIQQMKGEKEHVER